MRRQLMLAIVALAVATSLAGCAQADDPGSGDGLHSTVPDVTGMTVEEATDELESAGYSVGAVKPEGATGEVARQQPRAGYSAPRGEVVDLTVAE